MAAEAVPLGGVALLLTVGDDHVCALLETGAVRCWGEGNSGELGYGNLNSIGDDEPASVAGDVPFGGSAVAVAAGDDHTCALLDTGAIRCWGLADAGQLGYGTTTSVGDDEPASAGGDVPVGVAAAAIAAGENHACALVGGGAMRCWGLGASGRLGYGSADDIGNDEPAFAAGDVPVGGAAVAVAGGGAHTCALLDTGAVRCWGLGESGRLGYGNTQSIGDDEPASTAGDVPYQ
jgi:hypothetical protein